MHYSFPAWMFASGVASPCFTDRNNVLSHEDKQMMGVAYPLELDASETWNLRRIGYLDNILEQADIADTDRSLLEEHRGFLKSNQ